MKKIIKYLALPISFSLIPTFAFTPALANSNEAMAPSETREARIDQGSQLQEKENLKPSGGQGEYSIKPQEGNWRSAGRLYPQGKDIAVEKNIAAIIGQSNITVRAMAVAIGVIANIFAQKAVVAGIM